MSRHEWIEFNSELATIPSDFPEGYIRVNISNEETRLSRDEFEAVVTQIRHQMGWFDVPDSSS